jgi:hypothetical protein
MALLLRVQLQLPQHLQMQPVLVSVGGALQVHRHMLHISGCHTGPAAACCSLRPLPALLTW